MPIGSFLDSLPSILFIGAHILFLFVGVWAVKKATDNKRSLRQRFGCM